MSIPTPCFLPRVDCLKTPLASFSPINPFFFIHFHLVLFHPGAEACVNLKLALLVTSTCFGGGLLWDKIPALPLPRCVLHTWGNNTSLSAWQWEPNETRYVECFLVCSMPTLCHTISYFVSPFLLICYSHIYSSQLALAPSSVPSSISVTRALKQLLQNSAIRPRMEHVDGSGACEFQKLHSEFHQRRSRVLLIPTPSCA